MQKHYVAFVGKSLLVLVICAFAGLVGGCNDTVSDRNIEIISLTETRALIQDKPGVARAIDTRPASDFVAGHLPGAIDLELAAVSENKDSIDPALARFKTLVVYGADPGSPSARAMTKRLMRAGHKDVKLFAGGMAEWTGAGLKTEKGEKNLPVTAPAPARR